MALLTLNTKFSTFDSNAQMRHHEGFSICHQKILPPVASIVWCRGLACRQVRGQWQWRISSDEIGALRLLNREQGLAGAPQWYCI